MRKFYKFKKWAKEAKPSFSYKDESGDVGENLNNIRGIVSGVFFNDKKQINTQDKGLIDIPADVTVKFEDSNSLSIPSTAWHLYRTAINSLLSVNKGDSVEFSTYINKAWYKAISITNPDKKVKKNIWWKEIELNELYFGAINFKDIPKVETTEFGGKTLYDDTKANNFLVEKLVAKFSWESTSVQSEDTADINVEDLPFY